MKQLSIFCLIILLAGLACSSQAIVTTPVAITPLPAGTRQLGVAGLITRNYPHTSHNDWIDFYESIPETGSLLGVYTNWTYSPASAGKVPRAVEDVSNLSRQYGFVPVFALSVIRDYPDGSSHSMLDLDDPEERSAFTLAAVNIAKEFQPQYLGLGVEINRLYDIDQNDFQKFVDLYIETYPEIKTISPHTRVFTIFQYELLKGGVFFEGDNQKPASWDLFEAFSGYNDLAAFTSYPFLLYDTPAEIPSDYYTGIRQHTSSPVAFTELGWPSRPLSIAPDSIYGGSGQEQNDFISRFFELTAALEPEMILWTFPYDIGPDYNAAFTSISLRENDGTPKSALAIWQSYLP